MYLSHAETACKYVAQAAAYFLGMVWAENLKASKRPPFLDMLLKVIIDAKGKIFSTPSQAK